jgi:hypothetical protein
MGRLFEIVLWEVRYLWTGVAFIRLPLASVLPCRLFLVMTDDGVFVCFLFFSFLFFFFFCSLHWTLYTSSLLAAFFLRLVHGGIGYGVFCAVFIVDG